MPVLQAITFWLLLVHPAPEKAPPVVNVEDGSQEQLLPVPKKTFKEKVRLIPSLMGYMIPLTSIYLFEYFINQGLVILLDTIFKLETNLRLKKQCLLLNFCL